MYKCEYKRCGDKGLREVSEDAIRNAQEVLIVDGEQLLVCKSCAVHAYRDLRAEGRMVERARV